VNRKMADLEKFRRHIARPVNFSIANEDGTADEFEFKPISVELFTEFMLISEKLDQGKEEDPETQRMMVKELLGIYVKIVRESYPDLDEETARSFVMSNFVDVVETLQKIMPVKVSQEQQDQLKKKLEMMRKGKDGAAKGQNTPKAV
jgi:hypothetical protein